MVMKLKLLYRATILRNVRTHYFLTGTSLSTNPQGIK